MRYQWFHYLSFGILGLAFVVVGYVGWQLFRPINVIDMNQPYPVINTQLRPGETIAYETEYTKHLDAPGTVHKTIICDDGQAYTLPSRISSIPTGYNKLVSTNSSVPLEATPATCYLDVRVYYQINQFRTVPYQFVTEEFEIIQ